MKFVSLHHHSTFSYLDGFGTPAQHVKRAAELGMGAMALTEHGNVSSHAQLEKAATEAGVKPIFGCELYCGEIAEETRTQRKNHLTVLAENQTGYRNLLTVVSRGWKEGFYYEPTVDGRILEESKDGLVVLSGCTGSLLATALIGGKNVDLADAGYARARRVARRFKRSLGDNYYLEVQTFPELESVQRINAAYEQLGSELGLGLVATADVHYCRPEDSEMQKILHAVRGGRQTVEQQSQDWEYDIKLTHPRNDRLLLRRLRATGLSQRAASQAIANSAEIAQRCTVVLPKMDMVRYPLPAGVGTGEELFRRWINEGWVYRQFHVRPRAQRRHLEERVKYEMGIILEKDYVDYFLVVSDAVRFAKDHGIAVGPARGSAAASLVCFLLRITEVDPMLFPNLVFERFIDTTREDLPDIDLDFDDERRHEVRSYLVAKYGEDKVGNIGTFTAYKGKNSIDDIARVYRIPKYEAEVVKELMIERSSGDARANATIEDTLALSDRAREIFDNHPDLKRAMQLEGNYKGMGVHAAGIVVSTRPLHEVCATYSRTVNDQQLEVISYDKYDAETMGLLKIDVLGLKTMTMLRIAADLVGMSLEELYRLPLDDEPTIQGFRDNDVLGVFQFDGRAQRNVNGQLKPDNFFEVCDVNALSRPGPLHSGATADYITVKNDADKRRELHPLLAPIVAHTHGEIVYQEQILRIVMEIGGFGWTDAAYIRKIISRKMGEQEFNRQGSKFMQGAKRRGVPADEARRIWNACITAGAYAFCATGDTVVYKACRNGHSDSTYTLSELWQAYNSKTALGDKLRYGQNGKRIQLQQMDDDGRLRPRQFIGIKRSPARQLVYRVTTADGNSIKTTLTHRLLTSTGYRCIEDIKPGDQVVCSDPGFKYSQYELDPRTYDGRSRKAFKTACAQVLVRSEICEHCGVDVGRMEFAHVLSLDAFDGDLDKFHSATNILRLCNSCHKRFDYAKGERKRRDTRGKPTYLSEVVSIAGLVEPEWVYEVEMEPPGFNFLTNGIISHNNAAHCTAYGYIAYWCMYFKRHHPQAFYVGALSKLTDGREDRQISLLRDAAKHGIKVLPPHPARSLATWKAEGRRTVRAGLTQIKGVGAKQAQGMLAYRETQHVRTWEDYLTVRGFGQRSVERIASFCAEEDPFQVFRLERQLAAVKGAIRAGDLGDLPYPTHTSLQVPYAQGADEEVTWLGIVHYRNLRELFELHFSRTGETLDPESVRDPHLNEWVVLRGEDHEDLLALTIDRWKYPRFKRALWSIRLGQDVVLVRGVKYGRLSWRMVHVSELWVIDPD